jgi:resuscitation-promoting factor RpfB
LGRTRFVSTVLRIGRLALVTYLVGLGTWTLLGPTPFARAGASGGAPLAILGSQAAPVTVTLDGLAANIRAGGTVAETLHRMGLATDRGDRLSTSAETAVLPGHRVMLDRGLPVTLIDGGVEVAGRSVRGTVADLLAAAGVTLGPLDRVDRALADRLYPGDVIRITRIAEREVIVQEDVAFAVRTEPDPNLERSRQIVATPGQPGKVERTYRVRIVDGTETARTLLASLQVSAPVTEVRRVGTRTPAGASEIEQIIREAAAAQGANADQLLRVAYCESRYNPGAVNSSSGAAGLFQFMPGTWAANSVRAGYAGANVFDPVAAANVAAWMFVRGQAGQWSCK